MFGGIARPNGGGEAEGCVVGDGDGFVKALHTEEHGYGAEELFAVDGGGAGDAGEDGGFEVVAVAEHAFSAGEDAGACGGGGFDLGFDLLEDAWCGEGTDVGCVLHGVADFHGFHAGDEAGLEGGVDLFVDEEALGGDAGLAGVDAAGFDGGCDGEVEVGGGHDDEGVGAAELEDGFFDEPAGLGGDGSARGLAAGEGNGGDALVAEDGLDLAGFDEEGLEGAAGEAGAADEGFDAEGALRDVGCVLEEADVAGHERGGEEAEDLPEGEVPGHDGEDDTEWVPADVGVVFGGDGFGGEDAGGVVGVIAASGGALQDFLTGGVEGLAHLEGDEGGEVVGLVLEDGGELAHAEGAVVEGDALVVAESFGSEGDFFAGGLGGEGIEAADEFAGCGIDGFDGHACEGP